MIKKILYQVAQNSVLNYLMAIVCGLAIGFEFFPVSLAAIVYLVLAGACVFFAFQNDLLRLFSLLPYMVYSELFIRAKVSFVPYLFMQYLLIAVFSILIMRQGVKVKMHSKVFILIVLFCFIEMGNSIRSNDPVYARGLIINTLVLTLISVWGCFNILKPRQINVLLNHIKTAAIFLCGYALVRQILGGNTYGLTSNSEAVNGLPAVQLSGYLGFSASIFFLAVMSMAERKELLLNLVLLGINSLVVVISFSRGGIYFLGATMALYFLFNRKDIKSYFIFLLLLPVSLSVYLYVTETTNGLIKDRYSEEGSSGRDQLVQAGFDLFSQEPFAGVGTGNFNSEIRKRGLYAEQSGAHNEFVRVVAEHGFIGIFTYWLFFIFLFFQVLGRRKIQREYAIYFFALFCLIIIHNGLKISIQPLILMLVVATPSFTVIKKKMNVPVIANPA